MAKRKAARRARPSKPARKAAPKRRSAQRPTANRATRRPAKAKAVARKKAVAKKKKRGSKAASGARRSQRPAKAATKKLPRLDRVRRTLEETVQTPPSSLDMDRHASAARSGRAEMEHNQRNHHGMPQDITGGDVDVDVEDAYFTGDEAPGGDNPSPDLEVVDDIGKALGVEYADNEELQGSPKVIERDKHRWEMDPASSEDYKDRD